MYRKINTYLSLLLDARNKSSSMEKSVTIGDSKKRVVVASISSYK